MELAVAEPVVAFQDEADAGNAPIRPLFQVLQGQRVNCTGLSRERWTPGSRVSGRHLHGPGGQWIAIVHVAIEPPAGLHVVDDADHMGGHVRGGFDRLLARQVGRSEHAIRDGSNFLDTVRSDTSRGEQVFVFVPQGIREVGWIWYD